MGMPRADRDILKGMGWGNAEIRSIERMGYPSARAFLRDYNKEEYSFKSMSFTIGGDDDGGGSSDSDDYGSGSGSNFGTDDSSGKSSDNTGRSNYFGDRNDNWKSEGHHKDKSDFGHDSDAGLSDSDDSDGGGGGGGHRSSSSSKERARRDRERARARREKEKEKEWRSKHGYNDSSDSSESSSESDDSEEESFHLSQIRSRSRSRRPVLTEAERIRIAAVSEERRRIEEERRSRQISSALDASTRKIKAITQLNSEDAKKRAELWNKYQNKEITYNEYLRGLPEIRRQYTRALADINNEAKESVKPDPNDSKSSYALAQDIVRKRELQRQKRITELAKKNQEDEKKARADEIAAHTKAANIQAIKNVKAIVAAGKDPNKESRDFTRGYWVDKIGLVRSHVNIAVNDNAEPLSDKEIEERTQMFSKQKDAGIAEQKAIRRAQRNEKKAKRIAKEQAKAEQEYKRVHESPWNELSLKDKQERARTRLGEHMVELLQGKLTLTDRVAKAAQYVENNDKEGLERYLASFNIHLNPDGALAKSFDSSKPVIEHEDDKKERKQKDLEARRQEDIVREKTARRLDRLMKEEESRISEEARRARRKQKRKKALGVFNEALDDLHEVSLTQELSQTAATSEEVQQPPVAKKSESSEQQGNKRSIKQIFEDYGLKEHEYNSIKHPLSKREIARIIKEGGEDRTAQLIGNIIRHNKDPRDYPFLTGLSRITIPDSGSRVTDEVGSPDGVVGGTSLGGAIPGGTGDEGGSPSGTPGGTGTGGSPDGVVGGKGLGGAGTGTGEGTGGGTNLGGSLPIVNVRDQLDPEIVREADKHFEKLVAYSKLDPDFTKVLDSLRDNGNVSAFMDQALNNTSTQKKIERRVDMYKKEKKTKEKKKSIIKKALAFLKGLFGGMRGFGFEFNQNTQNIYPPGKRTTNITVNPPNQIDPNKLQQRRGRRGRRGRDGSEWDPNFPVVSEWKNDDDDGMIPYPPVWVAPWEDEFNRINNRLDKLNSRIRRGGDGGGGDGDGGMDVGKLTAGLGGSLDSLYGGGGGGAGGDNIYSYLSSMHRGLNANMNQGSMSYASPHDIAGGALLMRKRMSAVTPRIDPLGGAFRR